MSAGSELLQFESIADGRSLIDPIAGSDPRRCTRRRVGKVAMDRSVLLACAATVVVHLMYLSSHLGPDEGGLSTVARFWNSGGPYLYGPQWVDRPPALITVFAVANALGPFGTRLLATACAVVLVGSVASAARSVAGVRAARWAAWVGFALASSALLHAQRLNGELVAATLVALSAALILRAVGQPVPSAVALALLSGAAASSAIFVKQNFVDATGSRT